MALFLLCHRLNTTEARVLKIGLEYANRSVFAGQYQFQQRGFRTSAGYFNIHDSLQKRNNSASATIGVPTSIRAPPVARSEEKTSSVRAIKDEVSSADVIKEKTVWAALKVATMAYDLLTLPIYTAVQQPWKKLKEHQCTKSTLVSSEKHEWTTFLPKSKFHVELLAHNIDTMDKLFTHALTKYAPHNCLGTREVLGESEELDATGKLVKKYELGDYSWIKYGEVDRIAKNLAKTWHTLGLKPGDKLGVFAETRADWLMTAIAAFRYNMPIATVYTTLGDDGVVHALTETEVTCLVTSEELMPRCVTILKHTPRIKHLVYMDKAGSTPQYQDKFSNVNVKTLSSLIKFGESQPEIPRAPETVPKPDDPAIVMYTSGSTGVPKGVIISHYNLVSALRAATDTLDSCGDTSPDDSYIAFLPLAHSLELISESMSLIQGIKIGYSSALTLTDKSVGIKEGTKGDASLLRPTVIISVPLVLERIIKGIQTKVAENGRMAALIFDFFCKYKMGWARKGYETPLVDRVFFKKIRDLVGGRIRVVICGGAPLAPQLHEFVRTILCAPVVQGYGLTESCGSGVLCLATDLSVGRVGGPITCTKVRLINWEEGGYRVTDKPYPRGEVYIGGDNVAMGYFKRPENTDFFVEDGVRWFKTGDIAEVHTDGGFRIIDRKKDLVKLSLGEFVSLGKIEAALKTIPLVENICVCANSFHPRPVAIVVAAQVQLLLLAKRLHKTGTLEELAQDPDITAAILKEIQRKAKALKLENHEIPSRIHVCSEPWMPQSGLVTAAFKIKRNNVYKAYEKEIEELFSQI